MTTFLIILLIILSLLMVLVVLVQRGRGGGLSGAFGSGGGSNSAFGTKTGDVFTTVTVILFVAFMLVAIGLTYRFRGSAVAATTAPAVGGLDVNNVPPLPTSASAPAPLPETTNPATSTATGAMQTPIVPLPTRPATTSAPK